MTSPTPRRAAASLVEVAVALFLLSAGAVALLGLLSGERAHVARSRERVRADLLLGRLRAAYAGATRAACADLAPDLAAFDANPLYAGQLEEHPLLAPRPDDPPDGPRPAALFTAVPADGFPPGAGRLALVVRYRDPAGAERLLREIRPVTR